MGWISSKDTCVCPWLTGLYPGDFTPQLISVAGAFCVFSFFIKAYFSSIFLTPLGLSTLSCQLQAGFKQLSAERKCIGCAKDSGSFLGSGCTGSCLQDTLLGTLRTVLWFGWKQFCIHSFPGTFYLNWHPGNKQERSGRVIIVREVMVIDSLGFLSDSTAVRPAKVASWESQWMKPCLFLNQWSKLGWLCEAKLSPCVSLIIW